MLTNRRNTFVISQALRNFLGASILTSVSSQLAVTTDAIVVGNLVGPDAVSAINITMPINMLFSCVSILIGLGASILSARAIGSRENSKVNHIFSVALLLLVALGAAVSLFTYTRCEDIMSLICSEERINPLAVEYADVITGGAIFPILSNGINYFVSTDGAPSLVAKGVIAGAVANILLDILLVGFMGISGSAWATVINYTVTLAIVCTHFKKKSCSYRLVNPFRGLVRQAAGNIYEGLPLMLGNMLLGVAVLVINKMILSAAGADGLYIWSICLQVLLLTFVVLNGVGNAILSIGGILVGERDYNGVRILTRISLKFVCTVVAIFVVAVMIFPQFLSFIFGNNSGNMIYGTDNALRIFSLLLVPFAITLIMRLLFQILEYRILSLLMSAGQLAFIIASLWIFIDIDPEILWWSFPFSAMMLIVIQIATTAALWLKRRDISPITLIPKVDRSSIDLSIAYKKESIEKAIDEIRDFLSQSDIDKIKTDGFIECFRKVAVHVAGTSNKKKGSFDVHIHNRHSGISTTLRASGEKFTELITDAAHNIEFKYMYGQNVVFIKQADRCPAPAR